MEKLRQSTPIHTHFAHPGILAGALFGALSIAVLLSSCEYFMYKRPFADPYYDNNFIAYIDFDRLLATADVSAAPAHGVWDFAYRYDGWDGFEYLTLARATDPGLETAGGAGLGPVPPGLSASAPVYRLEMRNLAEGGDFEDPADDPAVSPLWTVSGYSDVQTQTIGAINGTSAALAIETNSPVSYLISPPAGLFTQGSLYSVDFRWKALSFPAGDTNRIRMNERVEPFSANSATFRATSQFQASGGASDRIVFDVPSGWDASIDDVTVKKVGGMELRLLLAQGDTNPELKDLLYRFSVWVHEDPSVGASSSPYRLDYLEAQMQPTPESIVSTKPRSRYDSTAVGWQIVEVEVENGNLMFPDRSADPVLELVIDLDDALPGRVLLAQPELRAYPDGYPE